MSSTVVSAVLCVFLAGAALPAVGNPVYKWVDESGVVNYSSNPPPGRGIKAKIIDPANSRLSSYSPMSAQSDANSQMRRNNDYLRVRAEQLQRQLEAFDYARQSAAEGAKRATRLSLEQCQRQRRVDCDDAYEEIVYPRVALVSRQARLSASFLIHGNATRAMPSSHHRDRHPGGTRGQP